MSKKKKSIHGKVVHGRPADETRNTKDRITEERKRRNGILENINDEIIWDTKLYDISPFEFDEMYSG